MGNKVDYWQSWKGMVDLPYYLSTHRDEDGKIHSFGLKSIVPSCRSLDDFVALNHYTIVLADEAVLAREVEESLLSG
jgi:hypothetical protein